MLVVVFATGFSQALLVQFDLALGDHSTNLDSDGSARNVVLAVFNAPNADPQAIANTAGVAAAAKTLQLADADGNSLAVLLASCSDTKTLVELDNPNECDSTRPQPLTQTAGDSGLESRASPTQQLLSQLELSGDLATALQGRVVTGTDRRSTRPAGDLRISPDLIDSASIDSAIANYSSLGALTLVALEPDAPIDTAIAGIISSTPTADIDASLRTAERGRNAPTMAALLSAATLFTMIISLGAAALAATDRALERKRIAAHLSAIGVLGTVQRKAEMFTTAAPLVVGLVIATTLGTLSGSAWLRFTSISDSLPLPATVTILVVGLTCSALAALAAAIGTTTDARSGQLRTE